MEEKERIFELGIIIILASFFFYWMFYNLQFTKLNFLKRAFHISSLKSTSKALQLGGFPFVILVSIGLIYILGMTGFLTKYEYRLFRYGILGFIGISLYGYIDDRNEISSASKLVFQLLILFNFSFMSSYILYAQLPVVAIILTSFFALAIVNGANVLDGLDTLAYKIAVGIYAGYFLLSSYAESPSTISVSILCFSSLFGFYIYNREPAKIYLGEIGSICIGFTYIFLACLAFNTIKYKLGNINALALVLIPVSILITELTVSFFRRIYNKKPPFKGDQLHLHHIIKGKYNLSASTTATCYGVMNTFCIILGLVMAWLTTPIIALLNLLLFQFSINLWIGRNYWKLTKNQDDIKLNSILKKQDINLIDIPDTLSFKIIIEKKIENDQDEVEIRKIKNIKKVS